MFFTILGLFALHSLLQNQRPRSETAYICVLAQLKGENSQFFTFYKIGVGPGVNPKLLQNELCHNAQVSSHGVGISFISALVKDPESRQGTEPPTSSNTPL